MVTALTERSALALARAIRERETSASEVVEAHIERHRACQDIRAVVADRFDDARRDAAQADALVQSAVSQELPPLLGVPFTVKESIALAGMPHTAGLLARRGVCAEEDAPVVKRLRDAGAIPLGVTNVSELTLWIESENRVYGRTANPYDAGRTAGGSSGGEGAAVGCGGSPFGVATDIGGSIRVPAFFCGVFGHKPSRGAIPNTGLYPSTPGEAGTMLQPGPIARRAEDLMPLLRLMAGPDGEDSYARAIEFGDPAAVSIPGLTVTTVDDSSLLPMSRELRDARERAVGALVASGATHRAVSLKSWRRALIPFLATLQAGAGQTTAELIEAAGGDRPTLRAMLWRDGPHMLPTRLTLLAEMLPAPSGRRLHKLLDAGRAIAEELREAIGDGVLLHPAHPRVAPPHRATVGRTWLLTPAAVFNLAGVPVTEVPLGLGGRGLPLGVQVAAQLDCDHVSIAVAQELERGFGGWVAPRQAHR